VEAVVKKKMKKNKKMKSKTDPVALLDNKSVVKVNSDSSQVVDVGKKLKKGKSVKPKDVAGSSKDDEITLDLVKKLGGDKSDLDLLSGVDKAAPTAAEEEFGAEKEDELKDFLKSLGFDKVKKDSFIVSDKDYPDDTSDEEEEMQEESVERRTKNQSDDDDGGVQDNEISSTTPEKSPEEKDDDDDDDHHPPENLKPEFYFVKNPPPERSHTIVKTGDPWHSVLNHEPATEEDMKVAKYWLPRLEKFATTVWDRDVENYKKESGKGSKKSETQWINTVLKSGTLNDKMSAYIVLIQDSPVHNLPILETLVSMVSLKSRRPCLMAMETLQKLFLDTLLVEERKLRSFDKSPFCLLPQMTGGNKDTRDRYLITWLFEDRLKSLYSKFLDALDQVGKDSLEKTRIQSMTCFLELLAGNPEQEAGLLSRLVNKLGDPTRAVAAKSMYLLGKLLDQHPAMRQVVVTEVERLVYRQNIGKRAQYYGICFLSQILLDHSTENNLASKLIGIYFSFFKMSITKGEVDTKLMSALLTGVNRAFPFATVQPENLDPQLETMYKLVHVVNFNIGIQALTLLYQVMDSRQSVTDRFYTALYRKTLDPSLPTSSKQAMFLNLLYKAVKKDESVARVKAFIKRLLQICEYQPAHIICGILYLLSQVISSRPDLSTIQQALKSEAGIGTWDKDDDDDDEEHYEDVKEEGDEEDSGGKEEKKKSSEIVKPGWVHRSITATGKHDHKTGYLPQERNPMFCGAETSCLWELESLAEHFHPSVALFARNLLDNEKIKYGGDPLHDFTIPRFLDRFVFRNPKKDPGKNKPTTVLGKRNVYRPKGIKAIAPDSKDFINRDVSSVPQDEMFLYKYFKEKAERLGVKEDEDAESVTSEEFNNFLDKFSERQKDFDDEDVDFAGGVEEKEVGGDDEDEEESGGDDDDEDMDVGEGDEGLEDSEPEGLEGDDDEDGPEFENLADMGSGSESDDGDGDDIDMMAGEEEFDEEGFGEGDDEMEEEAVQEAAKTVVAKAAKGKKKKKLAKFDPNDLGSLLADAEEFAHLIDENEDSGGTDAVANRDNASKKQLKWETNRENFMKGKNWKKKPHIAKRGKGKKDFKTVKHKKRK